MSYRGYAEAFMVAREKLYAMDLTPQERKVLGESVALAADGTREMNKILALIEHEGELQSRDEVVLLLKEKVFPVRARVVDKMEAISRVAIEESERSIREAEESFQEVKKLLWWLGGSSLIVLLVVIWGVYMRVIVGFSKLNYMSQKMRHLTSHDELTGLLNLDTFYLRLDATVEQAGLVQEFLALLYLELNEFKEINGRFGRDIGDLVLQRAAKRLQQQVRETDSVTHVGGDKFAILLTPVGSRESIDEVTDRILRSFEAIMELGDGKKAQVSVSIGVACFPDHGREDSLLLERAEQAMHQAKKEGKGYCFSSIEEAENPAERTPADG
ncbi:MAG: GGDEF domain-containing protein [Gammaproteobacteria bacterium]|nr:GGDEF domain-containing protein [Gammaproteobacteria bacterium]